jgi:hypothetical protein
VAVVDLNTARIAAWNDPDLSRLPVVEPGLDAVVDRGRGSFRCRLWRRSRRLPRSGCGGADY